MKTLALFSAVILTAAVPSVASAVTYDAVSSFNGLQQAGGFIYFAGGGGGGPLPTQTGCPANTTCLRTNDANGPYVFKSNVGAFTSGTVSVPGNALVARPGANNDVQIGWIAPVAGLYQITAEFFRLDSVANFAAVTPFYQTASFGQQIVDPYTLISSATPSFSYSRQIFIDQNGYFAFDINPANDGYAADSIGVRFSVTDEIRAVPEPQSWIMMVFGFGLAGTALRRKTLRIGLQRI
jgi:PEP-CTERM motif